MKHRPSTITISLSLVLLLCVFTSACNLITDEPADLSDAAAGLTLEDALGRSVTFARPPQRITIAGKSALTVAGTLFMFPEAQERVVGLVRARQNVGDFLVYVDPSFDQKTLLAVDAGPEQVATTEPDVVILKSFMADKLGRALEEIDIPVVYVDLETPEQYRRDLAMLGQLLGNEERAEEIWAFYQSRLDRVADALEGVDGEDLPRVLMMQYSDQSGKVTLEFPAAGWIQIIEVELAGGVPVWKEAAQGGGWQVVNLEQVAAWDPDILFIISYQEDAAAVVEALKADPQWATLSAVNEDALYGFPGDIFSWAQPDPRWILGMTWLASKIHPERFTGLDMTAEVHEFFGSVYGMDSQAIEAHIIPCLTGDVH